MVNGEFDILYTYMVNWISVMSKTGWRVERFTNQKGIFSSETSFVKDTFCFSSYVKLLTISCSQVPVPGRGFPEPERHH